MAWSSPETVSEPASEPVSLPEAKEFLSIGADEDGFDTLLSGLITSGRERVEEELGIRLFSQSVLLRCDDWSDLEQLPIGPVSGIEHLKFEDAAGSQSTVDAAQYELTGVKLDRGVRPTVGNAWPRSLRQAAGTIEVQVTVGYDSLPKPLWTAVLQTVAALFEHREGDRTPSLAHLSNYRVY